MPSTSKEGTFYKIDRGFKNKVIPELFRQIASYPDTERIVGTLHVYVKDTSTKDFELVIDAQKEDLPKVISEKLGEGLVAKKSDQWTELQSVTGDLNLFSKNGEKLGFVSII